MTTEHAEQDKCDTSETLELYRVMVDTVIANEQRRQLISSVFLTLLAAGFGAAGAIEGFNFAYATAPAFVVSFVWFSQIKYLKNLATAKFHVIQRIEEKLSYQPFAEEWRFLRRDADSKKFLRLGLSDIEMITPLCVCVASAVHLIWMIWNAWIGSGAS